MIYDRRVPSFYFWLHSNHLCSAQNGFINSVTGKFLPLRRHPNVMWKIFEREKYKATVLLSWCHKVQFDSEVSTWAPRRLIWANSMLFMQRFGCICFRSLPTPWNGPLGSSSSIASTDKGWRGSMVARRSNISVRGLNATIYNEVLHIVLGKYMLSYMQNPSEYSLQNKAATRKRYSLYTREMTLGAVWLGSEKLWGWMWVLLKSTFTCKSGMKLGKLDTTRSRMPKYLTQFDNTDTADREYMKYMSLSMDNII